MFGMRRPIAVYPEPMERASEPRSYAGEAVKDSAASRSPLVKAPLELRRRLAEDEIVPPDLHTDDLAIGNELPHPSLGDIGELRRLGQRDPAFKVLGFHRVTFKSRLFVLQGT